MKTKSRNKSPSITRAVNYQKEVPRNEQQGKGVVTAKHLVNDLIICIWCTLFSLVIQVWVENYYDSSRGTGAIALSSEREKDGCGWRWLAERERDAFSTGHPLIERERVHNKSPSELYSNHELILLEILSLYKLY